MITNITPREAEKLNRIFTLAHELYNLCEDLRPAGGWDERVEPKFCQGCGRLLKEENNERSNERR